jgi:hypothetical protein
MYGNSFVDVIWIIEQTERANTSPANLPDYLELSPRRVSSMNLAVVYVGFVVACANGKDVGNCSTVTDQKQHLTLEIYFCVRVTAS